ncbi:unnamed protein product [Dovyalis caffra]|uniref:DUF4342 domain-containing protein n=1 Tax=Dovyalis caffra TaxID=77055 RepID=A0AAV1QZ85_9ROSI|nr:unnamed protein product [Dovyalis caffra]
MTGQVGNLKWSRIEKRNASPSGLIDDYCRRRGIKGLKVFYNGKRITRKHSVAKRGDQKVSKISISIVCVVWLAAGVCFFIALPWPLVAVANLYLQAMKEHEKISKEAEKIVNLSKEEEKG